MKLEDIDPTLAFLAFVLIVPNVFLSTWSARAQYTFTPMMVLSWIYTAAIVAVAQSGKSAKLSPRDKRAALWYLCNGCYFNLFLDVVSGQFQMMDAMSAQYQVIEPRYMFGSQDVRGHSVFWTSMCELIFQSPFGILIYYGYMKNKAWRRPLEIIMGVLQTAGVWWFYIAECYGGFPHLGGWPSPEEYFSFHRLFYFWFGFFFMGTLWVIVACRLALTAYQEITAIIREHDRASMKDE